jgi:integrase
MKSTTGIEIRHARSCPSRGGEKCRCKPSYQANVYSKRTGRIRKTFPTLAAAKSWRVQALHDLGRGTLAAPTRATVDVAADALLVGMRDGSIRNRNRTSFKPSAIRSYEQALTNYLRPEFGDRKLSDITRNDVQDFADALLAQGLDPSTVRNALMPLRVIYRRAVKRGEVTLNPSRDVDLPAVEGRRERVASPEEAQQLIGALPESERALWATALYAGLRLGELQALQAEDVDPDEGLIHVRRSWDKQEGFVATKSKAGERIIPISEHLRDYLHERAAGFYFATGAFNYGKTTRRAYAAWKDAGLTRITLHECRHSYSTFLDGAGISETRADRYMGHANHSVQNRYRHPSRYAEDAELLDEYLSAGEARKVVSLPIVAQAVAQ